MRDGKVGVMGVVDAPVWEGISRLPQENIDVGMSSVGECSLADCLSLIASACLLIWI